MCWAGVLTAQHQRHGAHHFAKPPLKTSLEQSPGLGVVAGVGTACLPRCTQLDETCISCTAVGPPGWFDGSLQVGFSGA